jgi:hypothetical protein
VSRSFLIWELANPQQKVFGGRLNEWWRLAISHFEKDLHRRSSPILDRRTGLCLEIYSQARNYTQRREAGQCFTGF